MLKRKLYILVLFTLLSAVVLSGCYPTGERRAGGSSGQLGEDNTKIEVEKGDMRANIYNLPTDYPTEIPIIDISLREWDIKELERLFIDGKTITEYYEFESDLSSDITRYVYLAADVDGNDYWLVYEPGRINAAYKDDRGNEVASLMSICDYLCVDKVFNDDDLASFPKSDAVKRVNKVLEDIGLTNVSEPDIWSVTAEKANELYAENFSGELFWTEKDDIYILNYSLQYNNIPIITDEKAIPSLRNKSFGGAKVTAVVSKDRIISFDCHNIFSEDQTSTSKVSVNYTPPEAFETLIPVYENIKLGYTLDYYDCRLVYYAVDRTDDRLTYSFAPAWQFDYSYEDNLIGITQNFELVSADKGIRIVNPEG